MAGQRRQGRPLGEVDCDRPQRRWRRAWRWEEGPKGPERQVGTGVCRATDSIPTVGARRVEAGITATRMRLEERKGVLGGHPLRWGKTPQGAERLPSTPAGRSSPRGFPGWQGCCQPLSHSPGPTVTVNEEVSTTRAAQGS